MSRFTQGEWVRRGFEIGVIDKSDTQSYGMMLVICRIDGFDFAERWVSNAQLISAAPDMYRALWVVLNRATSLVPDDKGIYKSYLTQGEVDAIRAALAKAEGE